MPSTLTGHDLLIRIDERVKSMSLSMKSLCSQMDEKVNDDIDYKEMVSKVNNLWDIKQRMIGWMIGAGVAGGTTVTLLKDIVEKVLAR